MKRFLSLMIALLLVLAVAIPSLAEEETIKRQENGLPDFEGRNFTIWYRNRQPQNTDDLTNMENVQKLEELLNCTFEFIHAPQGQEAENFAITMAEDKLPDMIFCGAIDNWYPGGLSMAYEDGVLYDYTDLINETNTPHFCEVMMNDDFLAPLMKDDSGRIVRLGAKIQGSATCDFWYAGITGREDYMAAYGIEKPETIADWYEALTTLKENGIEYPILFQEGYGLNFFGMAYGILVSASEYYIGEDGAVHYGPYEAVYKDFLTEMNKWYSEGLINGDFMNTTQDDAIALMLAGQGGFMCSHVWAWPFGYEENNTDENAHLTAIQYPKLNEEDELTNLRYSSRNMDDFKYITVDAEDPLACVVLLDTLYIPEISYLMGNGIEGVAWEYDENGIPQGIEGNEDKLAGGISEWHMYEDTNEAGLDGKWTERAADGIRLWGECGTSGRIPGNGRFLMYTNEEAEIRSAKKTDIETYVSEMQLKFVTGQTSLDEFDNYIQTLKDMGVEDLIKVTQDAYTRLEARR